MAKIVSEEKKLSGESEEEFTGPACHSRKAESKSNSQLDDQSSKPEKFRRRSRSFRKKSNFGRIGYRKQEATRAVSVGNGKRPHQRARTLMHLSHVHDLPTSPAIDVGMNRETVEEFRSVLNGLSKHINQIEKRFDKQLGAYHKRFEKMEQMQLTILANIRKLAMTDENPVKSMLQNSVSRKTQEDFLSEHII